MRGQMTIQGIVFAFIALIVVMALIPAIYQSVKNINGNATAAADVTTPVIASLIPVFMVLGVLLIPIVYSLAGQANRNNQQ